jgi:hypothetical protein
MDDQKTKRVPFADAVQKDELWKYLDFRMLVRKVFLLLAMFHAA